MADASLGILFTSASGTQIFRIASLSRRAEGSDTASEFDIEVRRFDDLTGDVSVRWQVTGSGTSPASPDDFAGNAYPSGTLSFAPGVQSASIRFRTAADAVVEPDEGLTISLFDPSAGARLINPVPGSFSFYAASFSTTILNDDGPVFISQRDIGGGLSTFSEAASPYAGPVDYLRRQFTGTGSSEVAFGTTENDFIVLLAGDDACNARQGEDVIDGGTGSNFLSGGRDRDVFFLDGRLGNSTWSTIADWEAGEQVSVWGWRPGVSRSTVDPSAGAGGYQGATLHMDLDGNGQVETSVTWSGLSAGAIPVFREYDGLLWLIG